MAPNESSTIPSVEAMKYLVDDLTRPQAIPVFEDAAEKHILVVQGNGQSEVVSYEKDIPTLSHRFHTLDGLIGYLKTDQPKDRKAIIFVGKEEIRVALDYQTHNADSAVVDLDKAPEFNSLMELRNGISQKPLWRKLVTDLAGTVDRALVLTISNANVQVRDESTVQINQHGLVSGRASSMIEISWPDINGKGDHQVQLPEEVVFNIPIYDCFENPTQIETRLELAYRNNSLYFIFHPRQLERTMAKARLALAKHLRDQLVGVNVTIHEGEYNE